MPLRIYGQTPSPNGSQIDGNIAALYNIMLKMKSEEIKSPEGGTNLNAFGRDFKRSLIEYKWGEDTCIWVYFVMDWTGVWNIAKKQSKKNIDICSVESLQEIVGN